MKQKLSAFILLHISILIYTLSGITSKMASGKEFLSADFCLLYCIEVVILGIYAFLWQQVISKLDLSIAYANKGATLIWSLLWATLIFKETISITNIIGIIVVIAGIILVNTDPKKTEETS